MPWELTISSKDFAINTKFKAALLVLLGATAATTLSAYIRRRRSVGSYAHTQGSSKRATVDQLLQDHLGNIQDVVPFNLPSLKDALGSNAQLALLCERHCIALRDFTGEFGDPRALVLGCAVGGLCFELAHAFPLVVGIDPSKENINAAKVLKQRGWMRYVAAQEGDLTTEAVSVVPEDIDRSRVEFLQTKLDTLPINLGTFDTIVVLDVLSQVQDPMKVVQRVKEVVRPGGLVVVASSYNWREGVTPKEHWIGGHKDREGKDLVTLDALTEIFSNGFDLLETKDIPALSRIHKRGYVVNVLQATAWQRRQNS